MRLFFTLLSLIPIFSFAQSITYTISGKFIKSEPDFKKLYINRDSVTLNTDQSFTYTGTIERPGFIYFFANPNSPNREVWVNGGNINIIFEESKKQGPSNPLYKVLKIDSVEGTKETKSYQYLRNSLDNLSIKYPLRNTLGVDSMRFEYFQLVKGYVEKNRSSYLSASLTSYPFTLDQKKDLLAIINDNPAHDYVEALETSIKQMELLKPGNKISDFNQPTIDGKQVSLYSLKSRFVLIQFWASWCAPCRWENPQFINLYSKYHPQGDLEIIDISLDTDDLAWKQAVAQDRLPWINVCDFAGWQNLLVQKYILTPHVPFNILIDSSHSIVASEIWPSQLGDILQKYVRK